MRIPELGYIVTYRKVRCMVVGVDPVTRKNPVLVPLNPNKGIGNGKGNHYTVKNLKAISFSQSYS